MRTKLMVYLNCMYGIMLRSIAEILGSKANFLTFCNVSARGSGTRW